VAQPADGAYLLLRMERENHPNLEEARRLLSWNGGGANSSGRGIANIDTQGNVHPDQFWQDITLGNVKRMPFSQIWDGQNAASAETLGDIRSIGTLTQEERQARMVGPCALVQDLPLVQASAAAASAPALNAAAETDYQQEHKTAEHIILRGAAYDSGVRNRLVSMLPHHWWVDQLFQLIRKGALPLDMNCPGSNSLKANTFCQH
jgi:hypothetical protein